MVDEKKCPFCAETIKAEAIKCRFCGSDLTASRSQIASTAPLPPKVASCASCNVTMVAVQKTPFVSLAGIIGIFIIFAGISMLPFGVVGGVLVIILGLIIGTLGAGKKTVMVCPQCGKQGAQL